MSSNWSPSIGPMWKYKVGRGAKGLQKDYMIPYTKNTWQPDSTSQICPLCKTKISRIYKTKHHCRQCGSLVCANCSKNRKKFKKVKEKQRICDKCASENNPSSATVRDVPNTMPNISDAQTISPAIIKAMKKKLVTQQMTAGSGSIFAPTPSTKSPAQSSPSAKQSGCPGCGSLNVKITDKFCGDCGHNFYPQGGRRTRRRRRRRTRRKSRRRRHKKSRRRRRRKRRRTKKK